MVSFSPRTFGVDPIQRWPPRLMDLSQQKIVNTSVNLVDPELKFGAVVA